MVKKIIATAFAVLISTFVLVSEDVEQKNFSLVEVRTDYEEIYDDGIYRKVYSGFEVLDIDGNKILSVGEQFDRPAVIKIYDGNYTIRSNKNNETIDKKIAVSRCNLEVKF